MLGLTAVDIVSTSASGGFWDIASYCGYALMVSSVLLVFMYLWAVFWRNQQMIGTVKLEMTEMVVSALLVSFVLGLLGVLSTLSISTFIPQNLIPSGVQPQDSIYQVSENYFLEVKKAFAGWIETAYVFTVYSDLIATLTPYTRPFGIGFISSPLAGVGGPIKQLLSNSMLALIIAYLINYAQYLTYLFALQAFLKYYLPLGLFLRCFTPTRKIGGSLIAVAAALILAFPILTTISYVVFFSQDGPITKFSNFFSLTLVFESLKEVGNTIKDNIFNPKDFSIWSLLLLPLYVLHIFLKSFFGSLFFIVLAAAGEIIANAFLVGYIMPTLNILVFVQTARGLSRAFGEEIDISSLTRLI